MKPWKKTAKAFEMATDHPVRGEMRRTMNRIVRAQLKVELRKECDHLKRSDEASATAANTTTGLFGSSARSNATVAKTDES